MYSEVWWTKKIKIGIKPNPKNKAQPGSQEGCTLSADTGIAVIYLSSAHMCLGWFNLPCLYCTGLYSIILELSII